MKKILLLIQLIYMSVVFAQEPNWATHEIDAKVLIEEEMDEEGEEEMDEEEEEGDEEALVEEGEEEGEEVIVLRQVQVK